MLLPCTVYIAIVIAFKNGSGGIHWRPVQTVLQRHVIALIVQALFRKQQSFAVGYLEIFASFLGGNK